LSRAVIVGLVAGMQVVPRSVAQHSGVRVCIERRGKRFPGVAFPLTRSKTAFSPSKPGPGQFSGVDRLLDRIAAVAGTTSLA